MPFHHRRFVQLENERICLTLLAGGGHIAGLALKSNGVNPLWDPPWTTLEPSAFDPEIHTEFGNGPESRLLAGIMGHNLCFDFFGPPSEAEAAAGLTVHGEASVVDWQVSATDKELCAVAELPLAAMRVERRLRLSSKAHAVVVRETVENLQSADRPVGWTQHVTLGPPFLAKAKTIFHAPATVSKVYETEFSPGSDRFRIGAEFHWPMAPLAAGGDADLRITADSPVFGAYTAHLMNPSVEQAFFTAYHPELTTLFGYIWKRDDFPWLGIWEENYSRRQSPWNGKTLTRGMEFGVSPMPEPRHRMVDRGRLFRQSCYRWIPARSKVTVEYCLFITEAPGAAETAEWRDGAIRCNGGLEISVD